MTLSSFSFDFACLLLFLPHLYVVRLCEGGFHAPPAHLIHNLNLNAPGHPINTTASQIQGYSREGSKGRLLVHRKVLKREAQLQVVRHFYLWTSNNSGNNSAQLLDPDRPDTIANSYFRSRKTFIIVHGFLGWGTEPWILHLKDKLLHTQPSNVISVDWPAGSAWWLPGYYTAVGRVPKVAKDLMGLLHSLAQVWKLDYQDLHLMGHSLGAHVAGLAAAPLGTVGRITGLDPAGLEYHNVHANQRLDSSDADYVDVIHTNGCTTLNKWLGCYGINENLGHSDFWPNGGQHQPSCGKSEIGCSHERAYIYYIESLDHSVNQTYYIARPCGGWEDYQAGVCACGEHTQYMGFFVNVRLNGTFYLRTHTTPPFAAQDKECQPGSATGPETKALKMAQIPTLAFILAGAVAGTLVVVVMVVVKSAQGRSRKVCVNEKYEESGDCGSSGDCGDCGSCGCVVSDKQSLISQ